MRWPHLLSSPTLALCVALGWASTACDGKSKDPALSRSEPVLKEAPVPPENGPQLGAIAELVQVRSATDPRAPSLGVLRAGARVARSAEPLSHAGCSGGWYAIRPRGFVCVGEEATLDLQHPTLAAMALAPQLDESLPYTYARAHRSTSLLERDSSHPDAVREIGKLPRRSGMAVVGSWKAKEQDGTEARLALLTSGHFVRATDLEAAKPSDFSGLKLEKPSELPAAFVVKRGVRTFRLEGRDAEKGDLLEYHARLPLSGRYRSVGRTKYWALGPDAEARAGGELWVRHQDVTVVQMRSTFPEFVQSDTRWVDISVITGTLVAYVGKRPVFATLVSVARELPAGATQPASEGPTPIPLGTFAIQSKSLTYLGKDQKGFGEPYSVLDAPWAFELSSGQLLHGAYWHDRFGIEHGAGNVSLSPADAAWLFGFLGPELPRGWHAVSGGNTPQVVIRR